MSTHGGKREGAGRKAGTPNKITGELKEIILEALANAHPQGAVEYLKERAKDNPTAFMALVGRVLPMTVAGDAKNPLAVVTKVELVPLKAD